MAEWKLITSPLITTSVWEAITYLFTTKATDTEVVMEVVMVAVTDMVVLIMVVDMAVVTEVDTIDRKYFVKT